MIVFRPQGDELAEAGYIPRNQALQLEQAQADPEVRAGVRERARAVLHLLVD